MISGRSLVAMTNKKREWMDYVISANMLIGYQQLHQLRTWRRASRTGLRGQSTQTLTTEGEMGPTG